MSSEGIVTYYKATAVDGLSFASGSTGRIDYGAALLSGEVIRHPSPKKVRDDAGTYLSVSVEPADCTGFSWPCRLFRVEPVGRVSKATDYPHKRCVSALRVVEELPAWMALGPNGQEVAALIERCRSLTRDEIRRLGAARGAALALLARVLISPEHFATLTGPWVSVMGRTWE